MCRKQDDSMTILAAILFIVLPVLLIGTVLIPLGVGIGYLLTLLPGVEIGMGIVAGAVFAIGIVQVFLWFLVNFGPPEEDDGDVEADVDEPILLVPSRFFHRRPSSSRRKRKKR